MISDEVERLRSQGKTDEEIPDLIQSDSDIRITASDISEYYAPPN